MRWLTALTLFPTGPKADPNSQGFSAIGYWLASIINFLIFLAGALSVIFLIVGGLRYTLSGGDPKNTAQAKNTIFYAIVGLVVALLSYAIVRFAGNQVFKGNIIQ